MPPLNMRTYTMLETTKQPDRLRRAAAFVTSGLRSNTQIGKIVVTVTH